MNEEPEGTLGSIEQSQAGLRESIEKARQLTERSEFLLQKHKQRVAQDAAATELDGYVRKEPD